MQVSSIWAATGGALINAVTMERRRWLLWFPVMVGVGIGSYFGLGQEPDLWALATLLAMSVLAAQLTHRRWPDLSAVMWIGPAALMLGLLVAQVRTLSVATPILMTEVGPVGVTGQIVGLDRLDVGLRLTLADVTIAGIAPANTPRKVRVSLRVPTGGIAIGDRVRVFAKLGPAGEPTEPGAFHFRRHLYFQGVGAVGFALGAPRRLAAAAPDDFTLEHWRIVIAERVAAQLPGAVGGMTTALLNGQPTAIPDADLEAMRKSGLQHLLSISGLHIGLVTGLVFLVLRGGMALWPALALHYPIKKFAAIGALAASFFYMLMVGSPVPTQRSVLMTAVMLLAVLVDRNPFSVRVVAVAALLVLLTQPESMIGPSFQMSFAAVIALIAGFEALTPWMAARRKEGGRGWLTKAFTYVVGVALTSLIAGTATIPYGLHHFQQMANYGLLANMIAVPITSFWVMPLGLLVYLLMPLGWEAPAVIAMGWGVEAILWTAHWVAGMPGAALSLPLLPLWGLALFTLAGLWLCLWQGRVRFLGAPFMLLALLSPTLHVRPDIRINAAGTVVGVSTSDGGLAVSTRRAGRFDSGDWAQRDGLAAAPKRWGPKGTMDGRLACDAAGCLYQLHGHRIGIALNALTLKSLCPQPLDALVTPLPTTGCKAAELVDATHLRTGGAHVLFIDRLRIRVDKVHPQGRKRPWD